MTCRIPLKFRDFHRFPTRAVKTENFFSFAPKGFTSWIDTVTKLLFSSQYSTTTFFFIKKYGGRRSISSVHSSSSTLRVIVGRTRLSILIYIYDTNQQDKKRIIIQRVTSNKARNVFNEKKRPPVFSLTL